MSARWHQFDRTLKLIAEQEPAGLLDWLAAVLSLPEPVTLLDANLSKELLDSPREVDVLWRAGAKGKPLLIHLEFQLKQDEAGRPEMGERLAGYIVRVYEREHLPLLSVVIYLRRMGKLPRPPFVIPSGLDGRSTLRCDYEVIKMWELAPETVLARPYPALWPLAGMMRGVKADTVIGIAQQIIETPLAQEQKSELIGQLVVLAGVQITEKAISAALRRHPMMDDLLEVSSTAQMIWKRGHKEGREEGRIEGLRLAARLGLEHRFGTLEADVLKAIGAADEPTLTAIITQPEEPLEQVKARLGLAEQPQ